MEHEIIKICQPNVADHIKCTSRYGNYKAMREMATAKGFNFIDLYRQMENTKKVSSFLIHLEPMSSDITSSVLANLQALLKELHKVFGYKAIVNALGYADDDDFVPTVYIRILVD